MLVVVTAAVLDDELVDLRAYVMVDWKAVLLVELKAALKVDLMVH